MKIIKQFTALIICVLLFSGCSHSVVGVYTRNGNSGDRIEFLKSGKVMIQGGRDVADYTVDNDTVQITHIAGGAVGKIDGDQITFSGNGIVAGDLRGTWAKQK